MKGDEWFSIELPAETDVAGLALDSQGNSNDYARKFSVETSADGVTWSNPVAQGSGSPLLEVKFANPQRTRFVRITQTGSDNAWWGISEVVLFKP